LISGSASLSRFTVLALNAILLAAGAADFRFALCTAGVGLAGDSMLPPN